MSDEAGDAALRRSIELLGKYGHLTLDETMERMELLDAEIEALRAALRVARFYLSAQGSMDVDTALAALSPLPAKDTP